MMDDIFSLLGIKNDTFSGFSLLAATVADDQTRKVIDKGCRRLKVIEESNLVGASIKIPRRSVDAVVKKVFSNALSENPSETWKLNELRIISYSIKSFLRDMRVWEYAIGLLGRYWKDSFFYGLTFFLLSEWNAIRIEEREKVRSLLKEKLKDYSGSNRRVLRLKDNLDFLEDNGPLRMAALFCQRKEDIATAPTLLGFRPSTISWSYYSDVILNYMKLANLTDLSAIEDLLGKNFLDRTKKLAVVWLVGKAENADTVQQDAVSKFTNRIVGDISIDATWSPFTGATDEECAKLEKAKEITRKWFARRVIEVFFNVCVQDVERKMYWMKYVDYIKDFRVVGSDLVRRKLEANNAIEFNDLKKIFIPLNSRLSSTAALVMYIKEWILIEFSDTGCLYVYMDGHYITDRIKRKSIYSIDDLKKLRDQLIFKGDDGYYYVRKQGRHYHKGEWQYRLDMWMTDKVINGN